MINEHKILNWAIGISLFFIIILGSIGFYYEKHENLPPKVVRNVVVPSVVVPPVAVQTYNYMTITIGSAPIKNDQKVAVVESKELNLWLQKSTGKAIISIIPFNKGSTQSFAIVYRDL